MAINKRRDSNGRIIGYTVVVSVPDPRTGGKVRRSFGTYLKRKDADAAERKVKIQVRDGTFELESSAPVKTVTVADAVDIWFRTKKQKIQANTATGYKSAIDLHVIPALGDIPVSVLTHDAVQRQVNDWQDEGMGARLVHLCVMILRNALARQVKNGTIPANVADGIEKPSARTRKVFTVWNDEEIGRFLAAAEADRLAPLWALTLFEGMRRGEALGLRWSDLDWSDDESSCVARISQTVVPDLAHGGASMIQDRAKNRSSQRAVMLTSLTISILKTQRDRQRFERQKLADLWSADDLIVTTTVGSVVNPTTVRRSLIDLIAQADLPTATTHGLRHMAATIMLKAGISPALVALKLGHSNIGTTVDLYGHLTVTDQSSANSALEAAAGRARSSRKA